MKWGPKGTEWDWWRPVKTEVSLYNKNFRFDNIQCAAGHLKINGNRSHTHSTISSWSCSWNTMEWSSGLKLLNLQLCVTLYSSENYYYIMKGHFLRNWDCVKVRAIIALSFLPSNYLEMLYKLSVQLIFIHCICHILYGILTKTLWGQCMNVIKFTLNVIKNSKVSFHFRF